MITDFDGLSKFAFLWLSPQGKPKDVWIFKNLPYLQSVGLRVTDWAESEPCPPKKQLNPISHFGIELSELPAIYDFCGLTLSKVQ